MKAMAFPRQRVLASLALTLLALVVVTETVAAAYLPSAAEVLGVTLLGGALRAGWQAIRMRAVVDRALGQVCASAGFTPLVPAAKAGR